MKKDTYNKKNGEPRETDFSAFFMHKSDAEQKKLLERVVRKANADQRAILDEYDKRFAKNATQ